MFRYFGCLVAIGLFSLSAHSQSKSFLFSDKDISYEGRVLFTDEAAVLMWPGTSVRVNFTGTSIAGTFKDGDTANYYNIIIDNDSMYRIHFDTIKQTVTLATGLASGPHSIQIFKRTEWDKGRTRFYGFELSGDAKLLHPPKLPKRKIEFFGNSITCGYAINDSVQDSGNGYYENNYDSYAAVTARHFNAQYHCTSKSGIGVMVSRFPLIMPEMYDRLDPTDSTSKWDFSTYTPDVVVVNLFQNDSWIVNMPDNEQFKAKFGAKKPGKNFIINAYQNLMVTLRKTYPKATFICMLGNMDITQEGSPWPGYVSQAVEQMHDPNMFTYFVPYKNTPGHPKVKEQQALADGLIDFIDHHVKW